MPAPHALTFDVHLDESELRATLERDVRSGLGATQKRIASTWFYDSEGSMLFEEITRLPEYYPTRSERALLERHAMDIASLAGADSLVELGAGSCDKTRLLLDALARGGVLRDYVPFDVSADFLREAAETIAKEYPDLHVHAVVGDFLRHLDGVPATGRRLVAFLGGTIGNLEPDRRQRFFSDLRAITEPTDHLLIGTDLVKDEARIVAAYDDAAGVTARFNRNVLYVLNRELDANFAPERFAHVVRWDRDAQWIEMRLRSEGDQTVTIGALGMTVHFAAGEEMLTEISARFTAGGIAAELEQTGFAIDRQWGAEEGEFLLTLAHPDGEPVSARRV